MNQSRTVLVQGVREGLGGEAERLMPPGTFAAVVTWPSNAEDDDGYPASDIVDDLTRALLSQGRVGFRQRCTPSSGESRFYPEPSRSTIRRIVGRSAPAKREGRFAVVTTADFFVARGLFLCGEWREAWQAVLVFEPAVADPPEIVSRLQRGFDWRREPLPSQARMMLGPGSEGGFAVVAARTEGDLESFARALHRSHEAVLSPAGNSERRA